MSLKSENEDLVITIDQQVTQVLLNKGNFADVLISVADRMNDIKSLWIRHLMRKWICIVNGTRGFTF